MPVMVKAIKANRLQYIFIVYERSGKSIVIEPLDKTLKSFDNPLGVLTNSPNFEWHATNLRNYLNLMAKNAPAVGPERHETDAVRSGFRHVGAARRRHAAIAICARCRLLAERHSRGNKQGCGAEGVSHSECIRHSRWRGTGGNFDRASFTDYTRWSSVADLNDLTWSFKTYNDQSIRTIDLRQALDAAKGQVRHIEMDSKQPIENISTRFK